MAGVMRLLLGEQVVRPRTPPGVGTPLRADDLLSRSMNHPATKGEKSRDVGGRGPVGEPDPGRSRSVQKQASRAALRQGPDSAATPSIVKGTPAMKERIEAGRCVRMRNGTRLGRVPITWVHGVGGCKKRPLDATHSGLPGHDGSEMDKSWRRVLSCFDKLSMTGIKQFALSLSKGAPPVVPTRRHQFWITRP
jgi:hypothetical protein